MSVNQMFKFLLQNMKVVYLSVIKIDYERYGRKELLKMVFCISSSSFCCLFLLVIVIGCGGKRK